MLAVIGGFITLIVGIIFLFGGKIISGLPIYMWDDFLVFLKGMVSSGLVLGGILAIIAGLSAIRDRAKTEGKK
ncbi:MAG: hypothetical protein A2474_00495 [Elusimicrobia bacterium RIFOXYC2_FULL_34_12]|nr:MAG: hypothetical protein A2474_00495 [Elusimicrobia bacterium RIFOXYC2_FULL_34_12]OGS38406.1 MAG: hypothetical protein A2551_04440 [Elusimicrobia bacterium RIFOXYD2_FULL_34_30]HAM39594.1 hypothetical protein [Elusimicrobiota bacterium]